MGESVFGEQQIEHCVALCSRQAGQRVSSHLDTIIPLIMYYARSQVDDELRESCQQVGINCSSFLGNSF